MPRALSVLADAHRQRADVGWIPLVTLTLWRDRYGPIPQSLTLHCSTATQYLRHGTAPAGWDAAGAAWDAAGSRWDEAETGKVEYLPLVVTTGLVGDSLEAVAPETAPASFDPVLANTVPIAADGVVAPRFSALFRNAVTDVGFDRGGGELTVRWLPPGGSVGMDDLVLYVGTISTIDGLEDETVTVRSTSVESVVRIPILGAAVGPGAGKPDPFPGIWLDYGWSGLELDADFGATFPPTCTNNPGSCSGPPSFQTDAPDFNADDWAMECLVDYTTSTGTAPWAFESRYVGLYRALTDLPGTTLSFDIAQTQDHTYGRVTQTASWPDEAYTTEDAIVEFLALPDPPSLAALQAHDHDTIHTLAESSGVVLGSFSTGADATMQKVGSLLERIAPPITLGIAGRRFIIVRIAAASMPVVPTAANRKNFTDIYLPHWTVT